MWWLVLWLSVLITAAAGAYYGPTMMSLGSAYFAIGIVVIYFVISAWIGIALHVGWPLPMSWVRYAIGLLPSLGLIGAVAGIIELFGLNASGADLSNSAAILSGLGIVLFSTLAGLAYSEFLILQVRVCGHD
jgi:hypothetical protein